MDRTARGRVSALVTELLQAKGITAPIAADERRVDAGLPTKGMGNLMLAVEAEFDIMIPAGDITPANFRSVAAIESLVTRVARADAA